MASISTLLAFEESLAGRRVLVTGHSGFTGGWLTTWLKSVGALVYGMALMPRHSPNLYELLQVEKFVDGVFSDIRVPDGVVDVFERTKPDVVVHLAAQPLVSEGYIDPVGTFASNVMGTINVLEAARKMPGCRGVVCITTDKVYRNREWTWGYREVDELGGRDPYSASKACAELAVEAYRQSYCQADNTFQIVTARGGNIVGGGDWSENRIVPDIVRAIVNKTPLALRNPTSVRPWQHVLALAHGYLLLANRIISGLGTSGHAWNFGPGEDGNKTVRDVVSAFAGHWIEPEVVVGQQIAHEAHFLHLDSSRARRDLGWVPPLNFDSTMKWTSYWYKAVFEDPDCARVVTHDQITSYRNMLMSPQ